MGSGKSKTSKVVDSNGNVNNNVVIEEGLPESHEQIVLLLSGLLVIKILEMCYVMYKIFHRNMKKKYVTKSTSDVESMK